MREERAQRVNPDERARVHIEEAENSGRKVLDIKILPLATINICWSRISRYGFSAEIGLVLSAIMGWERVRF